jgi:hypothetical protein
MNRVELFPVQGGDSFDTFELQNALHTMATAPKVKQLLQRRHHWTAVRNLSTRERTADTLTRAYIKASEGSMWTYAVRSAATKENIGLATLIRELPLRRLRLPLPPFPILQLLPGVVAEKNVPVQGSNITAWIDNGREQYVSELCEAYTALGQLASQHYAEGNISTPAVWTIEPDRANAAPYHTHSVLMAAGLMAQSQGYLDDGERNLHPVLPSTLFVSRSPDGQ